MDASWTQDPPRAPRAAPFAVALGNASLLGVGYLLLRRWALVALNLQVTVVLVVLLLADVGWPLVLQVVVVVWWLAVMLHGWRLARGTPAFAGTARQWLVAAAAAVPVLLVVTLLRVDGLLTEQAATEAHERGDCAQTRTELDSLGGLHRIADAPLVAGVESQTVACAVLRRASRQAADDPVAAAETLSVYRKLPGARWGGAADRQAELYLKQAGAEFDLALGGDAPAVEDAFGHLETVRTELPGRDEQVSGVLDTFLGALPVKKACDTVAITEELADRPANRGVLDRAADVVPKLAPAALVGCGEDLLADHQAKKARERFRQLLRRYPDSPVSARAERGLNRANTAIELARLRRSVKPSYPGDKPSYCTNPVAYRGAKAYRGRGPHRVMMFGQDKYRRSLPSYWRAKDPADAVLVVCAGQERHGSSVQTCPYESKALIGGVQSVTFYERKFAVRVYEVRTGRRIPNARSVEIGGASCPQRLRYEYFSADLGPPSQVSVKSSESDIRAAFESIVRP